MSKNLGKQAEILAEKFLTQQGFKLLWENFFCRYGEIDLIMRNTSTLIFVEVKMRSSTQYGSACDMVTLQKQKKIQLTSQYFFQQYPEFIRLNCRFDIVAFHTLKESPLWIQNAF